jgi:hypothetical protein
VITDRLDEPEVECDLFALPLPQLVVLDIVVLDMVGEKTFPKTLLRVS